MTENRREERSHLSYYLRVFDVNTGEMAGHLVDVTSIGVRLISTEPLDMNIEHRLRLDLTSVMNFEQQVVFHARCIWQEQDLSSGAYNCGLEILKITSKGEEIIRMLIEQFGE